MKGAMKALVAAAGACAVVFGLGAQEAQAQAVVGAELSFASPVGDWLLEPGTGVGLQLRVGWEIPTLGVLFVQPEVVGGFWFFPSSDELQDVESIDLVGLTAGGGVRLTAGTNPEPSLFFHAGYGSIEGDGSDFTTFEDGLWIDAGLALSHPLSRTWRVGGQAAFHAIFHREVSNPSLPDQNKWISLGAHLSATF